MRSVLLMKWLSGMVAGLLLCGCEASVAETETPNESPEKGKPVAQIAFLADIHLHDFVAGAKGLDTEKLPALEDGTPVLMRSMQAQLNSTRLFNENYYVLRAALDELVAKNVKLVALPGDFSDDGQPANVKALAQLLDEYALTHGMRFFAINGNHDPARPFERPGGKSDFLDAGGREVAVMSNDHPRCVDGSAWLCSDEFREWGYAGISQALSNHGFTPSADDIYYETPFGTADLAKRGWQWCEKDNSDDCIFMPDTSYLVEPQKDIWLLAIDANVYEPVGKLKDMQFKGSGNAGYNALVEYKPQLIEWIADVVKRADAQGKRLIAFSHFPMADFYDNTHSEITALFGENGMQMKRMPTDTTTSVLSDTGLRLHMAGHMHLYDVRVPAEQNGLVNIQVPSLAAWQPGYSLVTLNDDHSATVETLIQTTAPGFDTLFPVYQTEWNYRDATGLPAWDPDVLKARDYLAFTDAHLREVVRQRYVGREWPAELADYITRHSVGEALMMIGGEEVSDIADESILMLPAMTLAYDYYRIRNAGQFADLEGRELVYERLSDKTLRCDKKLNKTELQVKQFLILLSEASLRRDDTRVRVSGV